MQVILSYRSTAFLRVLGAGLVRGHPMRGEKKPRAGMILLPHRGQGGDLVSSRLPTQKEERRVLFGCAEKHKVGWQSS